MSEWTYIKGCINVDVPQYTTQSQRLKDYIEWVIKKLDNNNHVITGSERNVKFNVIPKYSNSWSGEKYVGDEYSAVSTFFDSALRDRDIDRTTRELRDFLDNLNLYCSLLNVSVEIGDGYEGKHIISYWDEIPEDAKIGSNEEVYIIKNTSKENHEGSEQLFRIRYKNWLRFSDEYATPEKIKEAVDVLCHLSPEKFKEVMKESKISYVAEFGFTKQYVDWCKYAGTKVPHVEIEK